MNVVEKFHLLNDVRAMVTRLDENLISLEQQILWIGASIELLEGRVTEMQGRRDAIFEEDDDALTIVSSFGDCITHLRVSLNQMLSNRASLQLFARGIRYVLDGLNGFGNVVAGVPTV